MFYRLPLSIKAKYIVDKLGILRAEKAPLKICLVYNYSFRILLSIYTTTPQIHLTFNIRLVSFYTTNTNKLTYTKTFF